MFKGPTKYGATNVLRRKARSTFSIVGIAIGISAVISLIAISSGLLTAVRTLLSELPADILVVMPQAAGLEGSTLPEDLVPKIDGLGEVEEAEPLIMRLQNFPIGHMAPLPGGGGMALPEQTAVFPLFGVALDGAYVEGFEIIEGEGFSDGATDEVMIGAQIAKRLQSQFGLQQMPPELPVGADRRWTVRGVFRTGGIADTALVVPFETAQAFTGLENQTSAVLVRLADRGQPLLGARDLTGTINTINAIDPHAAMALEPTEFLDRFGDDLENLQRLIWSIGLIAALAGAVGVLNTMMSNVHERTREIGLLLAVGWTRRHMMRAVLVEGLIISLVGGLVAIPLGIGLVEAASWLMQIDPVPQGIPLQVYALGLSLSLLLGLLGSLLPAWRASRLRPVEALREI